MRLNATSIAPDEAVLAFGPQQTPTQSASWNLSESGNLQEAAARLFAGLRTLDQEGQRLHLRGIAVQPIPDTGLGMAINDRLHRAAAPRPENSTLVSGSPLP